MEHFEWEERDEKTNLKTHMVGKKFYLAGCFAGIIEHFLILPFDNIKTHT